MKYKESELIVTRYVQNGHHWHEQKHASVLAIGQLRHQSATLEASPHTQQTLSQLINVMNVTVTSHLRHV